MYPGQYPQPNTRRVQFECPMISGYSTARFYAPLLDGTYDPTDKLLGCSATISNQMNTTVSIGLVPLDYGTTPVLSGSGTRLALYADGGTSLGTMLFLSGGGEVKVNFKTTKPVLEVFAEGGGPAQIRIQLESLIQWDIKGFDRLDPKYPPQLFQPKWSSFPWPTG